MLAPAIWYLAHANFELAAGWATNAVSVFFLFYATTYLQVTYRTGHDFARLAMVNVVQNAVALALVALVAAAEFLRALFEGGDLRGRRRRSCCITGGRSAWRPSGTLPIGSTCWWSAPRSSGWGNSMPGGTVLDSTLVLCYMGETGMGLYAMVVMAVSTFDLLPLAVSQVLYPRMAEQYGRTERLDGLLRMTVKPMLLTAAGMVPIIAAGWWLVGTGGADPGA